MTRALLAALLTGLTMLPLRAATDALSDVRAALGGDAALSQITSIHAVGKVVQTDGRRDGTVEVYFSAPERFSRVTRIAINPAGAYASAADYYRDAAKRGDPPNLNFGYGGADIQGPISDFTITTTRAGFDGDRPISSGRGGAPWIGGSRRQYAEFVIPLLARLTAAYPAKVTSSADEVTFLTDDGVAWVLRLDPVTRLPATLSWSGGTAMSGPVTTFSDYRKVGNVTWPFRLVTAAARPIEDVTIKKYEINKRIDDKVFR